jgi:signal transduction histidine kinase
MRQVRHAFDMTVEARIAERTRIARELHDTLLQSFHGLLLRFQAIVYLLPERPAEAKERLEGAIAQAAHAITEGRDAVQGLRPSAEIRYDDKEFRLRIRDDGKGIDPVLLASRGIQGHYGLRGMPERAALIGGKLAMWSEVGVGPEVELSLAVGAAYATSQRPSWLSRLFISRTPEGSRGDVS